jgi:S1-C subfamily serine protease
MNSGAEEQAGAGGRGGEEMEYVQLCIVRHGLGLAVDAGCVILEAGVEAAAAGVTVGARLASINGRMIADRSEFFEVLNGLKDGTTIVAGLVASARLVTAPPIVKPLFICTLPVTNLLGICEMH